MKLPFTKSAPFPASAFIPSPERLKMGVEAQAKAAVPPVNPALNTVASDRVAALGRSAAPPLAMSTTPPTPAAGPSMMMPAAPALRAPVAQSPLGGMAPRSPLGGMTSSSPLGGMAPSSPLGGMPTTSIASRGGPMSYSQQGVGTNNPNAYAVGRDRAPVGMRMLERAARRRDPRAILALAGMEQQNAMQGQQMTMQQMREAADAQRFDQQQQNQMTMFELQQQAMQQRDATNFGQQQEMFRMQSEQRAGESALEFQRRQEAEAAQRAAEGDPTKVTTQRIEGTDYIIPFAGNKAMGTLPVMKADAPLPAGLVPTGAVRGGVQYGQAETAQTGKAPSFTYEKDPSGKITGAVYPVQDPKTGAWRLQRADINGDGVISPAEAAAAGGAAPAAAPAGAAVKTKAGNTYTFK